MKKPWSVLRGPSLALAEGRMAGLTLPSSFNFRITRWAAIGATSIGIDFQFVRRRGWSLRWSKHCERELVEVVVFWQRGKRRKRGGKKQKEEVYFRDSPSPHPITTMQNEARSSQIRSGLTGDTDKLLCLHSDDLLLEQACTAALDAVQILVNLIRAIERYVEDGAQRNAVVLNSGQSGTDDQLLGLVTGGDVLCGGGVNAEALDGLDDVHDRRTAANTDPAGILGVVLFNGDLGGGALGCFDGGHGGLESLGTLESAVKKCGDGGECKPTAEEKRGDEG